MDWMIRELDELPGVAKKLLASFPSRKIFALTGELGAGKTTLIKSICMHLGVHEDMSSPTFSIVNEYISSANTPLYHIDLYRLNDLEEIEGVGLEDYLYSGYYSFIEWPSLAEPILPQDTVHLQLKVLEDNSRQLVVTDDEVKPKVFS